MTKFKSKKIIFLYFYKFTKMKFNYFFTSILVIIFLFLIIACYFGEDYVNLLEGGRRQISSLKVGDRVWTRSDDGKHLTADEIFLIAHFASTTPSLYNFLAISVLEVQFKNSLFLYAHND